MATVCLRAAGAARRTVEKALDDHRDHATTERVDRHQPSWNMIAAHVAVLGNARPYPGSSARLSTTRMSPTVDHDSFDPGSLTPANPAAHTEPTIDGAALDAVVSALMISGNAAAIRVHIRVAEGPFARCTTRIGCRSRRGGRRPHRSPSAVQELGRSVEVIHRLTEELCEAVVWLQATSRRSMSQGSTSRAPPADATSSPPEQPRMRPARRPAPCASILVGGYRLGCTTPQPEAS